MLIEVRVANLGLDSIRNSPVVVLQEKDGDRTLPIWIGANEYNAILMELAEVKFPRPLTHDLIRQVIVGLGAQLHQVRIMNLQDNTYFAQLELHRDHEVVQIDARPSDSIAIALRLKAPIFTNEELFDDSSDDVVSIEQPTDESDPETLQNRLRDLNPEDFGKFHL